MKKTTPRNCSLQFDDETWEQAVSSHRDGYRSIAAAVEESERSDQGASCFEVRDHSNEMVYLGVSGKEPLQGMAKIIHALRRTEDEIESE